MEEELGPKLRALREERNLTLKEAAIATSIRMNHLNAIEEGQMDQLISPVYAQGFIKQYASFLGLDGEETVRKYKNLFEKPQKQDFAYGIGSLEMRNTPGGGVKWVPNLLWLFVFFAMLGAAWFFARALDVI